jgi:23S rRNA (uracil1939-C5)-methyltransferase
MNPLCRHFGICGGCAFQDVPIEAYRELKQARIVQALARHGIEGTAVERPASVPPATRRRAAMAARKEHGAVMLGFHAARSHAVVDLEECFVVTPALARLVAPLRRILGEILSEGEDAELRLTEAENGIDIGLHLQRGGQAVRPAALADWAQRHNVARVTVNGDMAVQLLAPSVSFAGVEVEPPPDSFLQPTREGERVLQQTLLQFTKGAARIADLFAGCGTFTLALAAHARVHAVDSNEPALDALLAAARRTPKLKPVTIERRDLFRRPLVARELESFDVVLLDPPRAGAKAQAEALAASRVKRVAYVSCNPESFARDARILARGGYRITELRPVDQFLWSSHIELVALLGRQ